MKQMLLLVVFWLIIVAACLNILGSKVTTWSNKMSEIEEQIRVIQAIQESDHNNIEALLSVKK